MSSDKLRDKDMIDEPRLKALARVISIIEHDEYIPYQIPFVDETDGLEYKEAWSKKDGIIRKSFANNVLDYDYKGSCQEIPLTIGAGGKEPEYNWKVARNAVIFYEDLHKTDTAKEDKCVKSFKESGFEYVSSLIYSFNFLVRREKLTPDKVNDLTNRFLNEYFYSIIKDLNDNTKKMIEEITGMNTIELLTIIQEKLNSGENQCVSDILLLINQCKKYLENKETLQTSIDSIERKDKFDAKYTAIAYALSVVTGEEYVYKEKVKYYPNFSAEYERFAPAIILKSAINNAFCTEQYTSMGKSVNRSEKYSDTAYFLNGEFPYRSIGNNLRNIVNKNLGDLIKKLDSYCNDTENERKKFEQQIEDAILIARTFLKEYYAEQAASRYHSSCDTLLFNKIGMNDIENEINKLIEFLKQINRMDSEVIDAYVTKVFKDYFDQMSAEQAKILLDLVQTAEKLKQYTIFQEKIDGPQKKLPASPVQ